MSVLESALKKIRKHEQVPALAAAAHTDGQLREIAAVGKRRVESDDSVQIYDKWHIGSCTKAMTATLAGILVERGQLNWDTTIGDVFESWSKDIQSNWHKVTLEQLLAHYSGLATEAPKMIWQRAWERNGTPTEQRSEFVRALLAQPPDSLPNSESKYSNQGYAIAGYMLETIAKQDWEGLITSNLFDPLGMTSAGFGVPGNPQMIIQPYGHVYTDGKLRSIEPGPLVDNPAAIGPAGGVHCSIEDFLKFAASHAGSAPLVGENTLQRLHTRYKTGEFSLGWIVLDRSWGGGKVLTHTGSNTMWFATMWIAPLRKAAFVAATNVPSPSGAQACNQSCEVMIERLLS